MTNLLLVLLFLLLMLASYILTSHEPPIIPQAKTQMLFQMTNNISDSQFLSYTKKDLKAFSFHDCARKCVHYENKNGYCNAFR